MIGDANPGEACEVALRRSEERLRLAVEATGLGIWELDLRTWVMTCSDTYRSVFGLGADVELSLTLLEGLMYEDDRSVIRDKILAAIETGNAEPFETTHRVHQISTGALRWVSFWVRVVLDGDGHARRLVGTVRDITDRKRAELDRQASEERLGMALRAGRMVAWDRDLATGIVTRSQNADAIIGNRSEHVSAFVARVHPDDQALASWASVDTGRPLAGTVQFRYNHPNGTKLWLETSAVQLLEQGAHGRVVGVTTDITEKKLAEARLIHAADHDSLTGLLNRIAFARRLEAAVNSTGERGSVALLMLDVDSLKDINDTLGHDTGDIVLKRAAERLSAAVGPQGFAARLGGDEFAIVLTGSRSLAEIQAFAERVIGRLADPLSVRGQTLAPGASVGISVYPTLDPDSSGLVKNADLALYVAKAAGRGRARMFAPAMREALDARVRLANDMEEALAAGQIVPFYQPKIDLGTGRVVGFEALARWLHPSRGNLTPSVFGSVFEDGRLAVAIGRAMFEGVLRDLRLWLDRGLPIGRIAINLSSFEFRLPDLARSIFERLDRSGIDSRHLEVEVTETGFLNRNADGAADLLRQFHERGVKISLDDFGTGYASLIHLKRFPVDEIKLDRGFIADMDGGSNTALVSGIIALGKSLGLTTVAEGIETRRQAEVLTAMGCEFGQGFLFAKPMSAGRVPWFLAKTAKSLGAESRGPRAAAGL